MTGNKHLKLFTYEQQELSFLSMKYNSATERFSLFLSGAEKPEGHGAGCRGEQAAPPYGAKAACTARRFGYEEEGA